MQITPELPDGYEGKVRRLLCQSCQRPFYLAEEDFSNQRLCHPCSLLMQKRLEQDRELNIPRYSYSHSPDDDLTNLMADVIWKYYLEAARMSLPSESSEKMIEDFAYKLIDRDEELGINPITRSFLGKYAILYTAAFEKHDEKGRIILALRKDVLVETVFNNDPDAKYTSREMFHPLKTLRPDLRVWAKEILAQNADLLASQGIEIDELDIPS